MRRSSPIFRHSWASAVFGLLALCAAVAAIASDDDGMHDLDDVDTGHTESLDSVDTGHTESLDSVDTGHTYDLDEVEQSAGYASPPPASAAPRAIPEIRDGDWEAQAKDAKQLIADAEDSLREANSAYGNMMARDYPRGDARQAIIDARQSAEARVNEAWGHYGQIKKRARDAGQPL